jgi:hypothetical protein
VLERRTVARRAHLELLFIDWLGHRSRTKTWIGALARPKKVNSALS